MAILSLSPRPVCSQQEPSLVMRIVIQFFLLLPTAKALRFLHVHMHIHVVMDNGHVKVTLSNPDGDVEAIKYGGLENLLDTDHPIRLRGYMDMVWERPEGKETIDNLHGNKFKVITQNEDQIEVSFTRSWDSSSNLSPLNVDRRYIMKRDSPGFYVYVILERLHGWPEAKLEQFRIVFRLQSDKFHYMAISDDIQKIMPIPSDRTTGEVLAYPEAVLLTNASNPILRGEVDDKYMYSMENKDVRLKGWICKNPPVGFWMITPTDEYCAGGPIKQDLTSHVGPVVIASMTSNHYAGTYMDDRFQEGEAWKKVFGPIFIYLNSMSPHDDYKTFWDDAKSQTSREIATWPYDFVQSEDFPPAHKRGEVFGTLTIKDSDEPDHSVGASFAYVGLARPGDAGSWQYDTKGYQFWTRANEQGDFHIKNVRPGVYNLFAWVPGFLGDYKYTDRFDLSEITIKPGQQLWIGLLRFVTPRRGPTLWEIGIPDRSAAEFYIPPSSPKLVNKVFLDKREYRYKQYGLWSRYEELYPDHDLIYNVACSDYTIDWFFAHVPRSRNGTLEPTTWRINFNLQNVETSRNCTLQLALASASMGHLDVRLNNQIQPLLTTGMIGRDNAIARHGIHGLYKLYTIGVPSRLLRVGRNTIYLKKDNPASPFEGVMYDYIRLEAPKRDD
ncbi:hypothetical protein K2173_002512 [Erythroxylum novogranatense]|uniref:rhamnogalacturonan endolyase n=1 Tax=Erythroxylum novogranatense TaxID=1862640 RepID=A0AAV8TU55_9ROSI|nr:hypothetical protein K2173_002512 [Erythroxylum novogranatense]